jgi:hypothetical protein
MHFLSDRIILMWQYLINTTFSLNILIYIWKRNHIECTQGSRFYIMYMLAVNRPMEDLEDFFSMQIWGHSYFGIINTSHTRSLVRISYTTSFSYELWAFLEFSNLFLKDTAATRGVSSSIYSSNKYYMVKIHMLTLTNTK